MKSKEKSRVFFFHSIIKSSNKHRTYLTAEIELLAHFINVKLLLSDALVFWTVDKIFRKTYTTRNDHIIKTFLNKPEDMEQNKQPLPCTERFG